MTAANLTLTDFLLARIAEDEAVARIAMRNPIFPDYVENGPAWHCDEQSSHVAVAPARLLAECEAKRRIVEIHDRVESDWIDGDGDDRSGVFCAVCEGEAGYTGGDTYPCPTLRAVAAVYADHPDYDEAWRP